jgi:ribonucleotide reductase alpha subunit
MTTHLTKNIQDIPDIFTNLFNNNFDSEKALGVASILGNSTTNYEHHILAGRLAIYAVTQSCEDVESYIEMYKSRLNKPTSIFMLQNVNAINQATQKNKSLEYNQYDFFSAKCLIEQYLLKTFYNEQPMESIQMMHMRQAVQFYSTKGINRVLKCYNEMSNQYYTHATPTVTNAGTQRNQQSSCFLIQVADDMDDISETVHTISSISKLNGGVGIGLDNFRHSEIGHVGKSEGPIGFAKMYDVTIGKVRQGNTRNGAGTAFLSSYCYDFDEFISMTDNFRPDRFNDLNTCGWMNDLFFQRVQNCLRLEKDKSLNLKTHWTMFCPKKAEIMKGKYGIDFIHAYEELEILAEQRKKEYEVAVKEVERLHKELTSNPNNSQIKREYLKARENKLNASKASIDHHKVNAYELYKKITNVQTNSGMPYIMHADACQKSNQKNMGDIEESNLCLEVVQVTKPHTKNSPAEIASCNLASMNIPRHVIGKIDWTKHDLYESPEEVIPDLIKSFDFNLYGKNVHSVVENLNQVIDCNYYPLDERNEKDEVIKQGPISYTNFKNRPLAIGVSGQSDALALMECTYLGKPAQMFNKMLYANKYFNCHLMGVALSIRDGFYQNFRKGSYKHYVGKEFIGKEFSYKFYNTENESFETKKCLVDDKGFIIKYGSPISNGEFQFDLWQNEAKMLKENNLLNEKVYNVEDDIPLEPHLWGQKITYIYVYPNLPFKNIEITYERRECKFIIGTDENVPIRIYEQEIIVKPSWDDLRKIIMKYGVRNSLYVGLMPTASSANTLRNCEATEAHQSMIYSRVVKSGTYTILNRHLFNKLNELKLWNKGLAEFIAACQGTIKDIKKYILDHYLEFPEHPFIVTFNGNELKASFNPSIKKRIDFIIELFKTMYELSQKEILKQVAARGRYVCQSQSTNIYLKDPTPVQLEAIHLYTNNLRLKTGMYYLRQSPAESSGNFTLPAKLLEYVRKLGYNINDEEKVSPSSSSKSVNTSPLSKNNKSLNVSPISGTCTLEDKMKGGCADCMV